LFSLLLLCCGNLTNATAQEKEPVEYSQNTLDISMLGNKGFASVGYNRAIFQFSKFQVLLGPSVGYVPSSREDTANSIPRFLHLNVGTNLTYSPFRYFEVSAGVSYSKILLGDPYHVSPKSNYNRILGDFGLIWHFRKDDLAIKLTYTPILFDNGAEDVEGFPYGLSFRIEL